MSLPRLWSWRLSPFAAKARIVLAEKAIEYDLLEIDPRHRPPRLLELNPAGRVPTLELNGAGVAESSVIAEWAEEVGSEPRLWPRDPARRAIGRGLQRWVDDNLTVNFFLSMRKEAFGIDSSDHPEIIRTLRQRLSRSWPVLERLLARHDGPWLLGEEVSLADLAAVPLAVQLPQWKPELVPAEADHPRVTAWLAELRERPSAAEVGRKGTPPDG
ncbi:MAG TPA: glutathione S-transferase family protein [Solirubrobacteraceae bacterium]|nr:glutathione S-transferase family protein [Solirubrobacteraceae bacterium]